MDICISQDPPPDVLQAKRKYLRIIPYLVGLIFSAIVLAAYQIIFGSSYGALVENVAIALFVGPSLVLFYVVEQLHDYKTLSVEQEKEMEAFCRQDHAVAAYCAKVSITGRRLIKAEYDACQSWMKERA